MQRIETTPNSKSHHNIYLMDIIYVSAQPDDNYFLWQIELQIFNFLSVGIRPFQIHILLACNKKKGLNPLFKKLIESSPPDINFFVCTDDRIDKRYSPSIKLYLIKEYLKCNLHLQGAPIFLHDSDILFRKKIPFDGMLNNDNWYVSDTRNYLDTQYIKKMAGHTIFNKMCKIVEVDPEKVIANDDNCGGAQYCLKNTSVEFWEKAEKDSVAIYDLLTHANQKKADRVFFKNGPLRSEFNGVQAWCAEMWSIYWNALLIKKKVLIDSRLDFCWASEVRKRWNDTYILHYTGVSGNSNEDKSFFRKTDYQHHPPYYDLELFSKIRKDTSGAVVVDVIKKYLKEKAKNKIDLTTVTFIIATTFDWKNQNIKLLHVILQLLNKFYRTNIVVLDISGKQKKLNNFNSPVSYKKISYDCLKNFSLIVEQNIQSPLVFLYNPSTIIDPTLINSPSLVAGKPAGLINFCNSKINNVDTFLSEIFIHNLDPNFLTENIGKLDTKKDIGFSGGFLIDTAVLKGLEIKHKIFSQNDFDVNKISKEMEKRNIPIVKKEVELYKLSSLINSET